MNNPATGTAGGSAASPTLTRLRLVLDDASKARELEDALQALPDGPPLATSVFERDGGRLWQLDAYLAAPPDPSAVLILTAGYTLTEGPSSEQVPDENWVALSQAALPPVGAGRFLVHGSHDREKVGRRQWSIEIEAGEAFGTAHHATTECCLIALDRLAARRPFHNVLDLGCGSGVLAIAASRLWPRARVLASDIDPVAIEVARANVRLNRASCRVGAVVATGLGHARLRHAAPYDLVLANILAGPLIRLAPQMARHIRPGGLAVLSGILVEQAQEVGANYAMAGFRLVRRHDHLGWTTFTLVRLARS